MMSLLGNGVLRSPYEIGPEIRARIIGRALGREPALGPEASA